MNDNERSLIESGAFAPDQIKRKARAYLNSRIDELSGRYADAKMRAYRDTANKFGRSIAWVRGL